MPQRPRGFCFYLLYDKIHRADILSHAYALARSNGGAPGVDGITFETIEADGLEEWLAGLREDLVAKTYRPAAGAAGDDPEARRRRAAARHPDHSGPGGSDRRQAGAGADLRGGLRGQRLWLPPGTERSRRDQGSAPAHLPGLHRRGGRRSVALLRPCMLVPSSTSRPRIEGEAFQLAGFELSERAQGPIVSHPGRWRGRVRLAPRSTRWRCRTICTVRTGT